MNKINIIYEDNHILVVEKPVGVLSQSDGSTTPDMLTLLKSYIKEKYNKPGNVYLGLVHRLDKDVGGLMVFARTSKSASRLSEQIRNHELNKKYYAIIKGIIKSEDTITNYIERVGYRSKVTTKEKGALSILSYKVLKVIDGNSLIEIDLKTGRHHQIRVTFSSLNHSLLGDEKYGKKGEYSLALYCCSLSFLHPTKKEKLSFSLPIPNYGYFKSFK